VARQLDRLDIRTEKLPDGRVAIRSDTDDGGYYEEIFTASELRELAQEILELAGQ
jgi:hypothetical protein